MIVPLIEGDFDAIERYLMRPIHGMLGRGIRLYGFKSDHPEQVASKKYRIIWDCPQLVCFHSAIHREAMINNHRPMEIWEDDETLPEDRNSF